MPPSPSEFHESARSHKVNDASLLHDRGELLIFFILSRIAQALGSQTLAPVLIECQLEEYRKHELLLQVGLPAVICECSYMRLWHG